MIHDQKALAAAQAYVDPTADVIRRFLPMVRRMAWHLHGSAPPEIDPEDLIQTGLIALADCAARHTGPGLDGFAAYAKIRVKGAMIDLMRRAAPLSRGSMQRRRDIRNAEQRLRNRLCREPAAAELAAEIGMDPAEFEAMRAAAEPARFEAIDQVYSDSDGAFGDPSPDAFAQLANEENREALIAAIAGLPRRLQTVIQLYFVEELNLSEIAAVLNVSIPRVHQLKAQALASLREELAGFGPELAA